MATPNGTVKNFKLKAYQPREKQEQDALAAWLDAKRILFYAIPNGEKRDVVTAVNLKRGGVKKGVPDLCLPIPTSRHHGLYLELKRRDGGVTSPEQKIWIARLNENGYLAIVCKGWDVAREVIEQYLAEKI